MKALTPFRAGANFLLITVLSFPLGIFAQGPNTNSNPPAQTAQGKNINYYQQINTGNNIIQTGQVNQQADNPMPLTQGGAVGFFGSNAENEKPCTDCDEVKQAIKVSHTSSGRVPHKKSFSIKKWSKTFSGKMHMKMKKKFPRRHKVKTNYAICFNWH